MPAWKIIDTGPASAAENMALDVRFLAELAYEKQPILHLYSWSRPSATFGHFIDPYTLVRKEAVDAIDLELARRPTGGGMIFHLADFAFSVLVPASHPSCSINTLDNYACVNQVVIDVVRAFIGRSSAAPTLLQSSPQPVDSSSGFFCMAKPTQYDVMLEGKKVGGAAQRRTKNGFLHQGSISLALPNFSVLESLLQPRTLVLESMRTHSCVLLSEGEDIEAARRYIKNLFINKCSS